MWQALANYSLVASVLFSLQSNTCDAQIPAPAPTPAVPANGQDSVALERKMSGICRELKLFSVGGIPISGSLPSGVLNSAQRKTFDQRQQRLADRILLGLVPELLSPEIETRDRESRRNIDSRRSRAPRDFELLTRVLGEKTMSRYCDLRKRTWLGTDVFAQREVLKRFLKEQEPTLRKLTITPPLRFRTIESGYVGDYDFEAKRFPVEWHNTGRIEGLRFDFGLSFPQSNSFRHNDSLNVTSPIAYSTFWNITPDAARTAYQSLEVVRRNTRVFYASTTFDVARSPRTTPVYTGGQGERHQPDGVLITPVSTAVYADGFLKKKVWDAPLIVPRQPILQAPASPQRKEELYLWQPEIQVALLDEFNPDLVQRSDLVVAATSVFQEDAEYYTKGSVLSHRIRDLDRSNILGRRLDTVRKRGLYDFWADDYQPFFPASFFEPGYASLSGDADARLRDIHLETLRSWLGLRLKEAAGVFRLDCTIVVDRDRETAEFKPGYTNQQFAPIGSSLANAKELGFIARLTMPQGSRRRRFDNDESATEFSVVYPAISTRLQFAIDPQRLPTREPTNDDERYAGDVVVKIAKVQHVIDDRLGPQALIHVRPLRFECLGSIDPRATFEERLAKSGSTAFVLPVDIPEFTEADRVRRATAKD